MKVNTKVVIYFVLLFALGCKKAPVAPIPVCIVNVDDTDCVGQPLQFTSCTKGSPSCIWNFGDDTIGVGTFVWHTYNVPGTYTVKVRPVGNYDSTQFYQVIYLGYWNLPGTTFFTDSGVLEYSDSGCTLKMFSTVNPSNWIAVQFGSAQKFSSTGLLTTASPYSASFATDQVAVVVNWISNGGQGIYYAEPNQTVQIIFKNGRTTIGGGLIMVNLGNSGLKANMQSWNLNYSP